MVAVEVLIAESMHKPKLSATSGAQAQEREVFDFGFE